MSVTEFVNSLLETGRVRVPAPGAGPAAPLEGLDDGVAALDRVARPQLAFDPPPLSPAVAGWALTVLYRACQALVYREMDARQVAEALARPCPQPPSPATSYAADLSFRYLPDVIALARGIAPQDPLVEGLTLLSKQWPLSSVGVTGVGDVVDVTPFFSDASLRQLYVDRIIEKSDASRLNDPIVRDAVRESLGDFTELAPRLAPALAEPGTGG